MNMSTHRQGKRVVMLYPAEALNEASANALLKTLEEPPPETVFLLVSNSLDRLLPTILSRCRKFVMGSPRREQALPWLQAEGVADAEAWLAEQGGAPLAAQEMAHSELRAPIDELLVHLATPGTEGALKTAERLRKFRWRRSWRLCNDGCTTFSRSRFRAESAIILSMKSSWRHWSHAVSGVWRGQ